MSSLSPKANKSRSPASQKARAKKGKKAVKKPQRPGKITATPKSKKAAAKPKKSAASAKKSPAKASKKAASKKKALKSPASKAVKKSVSRKVASKKPVAKQRVSKKRTLKQTAAKSKKVSRKQTKEQPRKVPAPRTILAVNAFDQAMKLFYRHDYAASKSAFDDILEQFGDQAEVVARVRTYLTICEQRLAREPSTPRNPDALYNRGVFELNKGNNRGAVDLFEKALRADPRAHHILYSLAAAYARLNYVAKALDALRRAIALWPIHRSHARRDRDFASLHTNEDFQRLTGFGLDLDED